VQRRAIRAGPHHLPEVRPLCHSQQQPAGEARRGVCGIPLPRPCVLGRLAPANCCVFVAARASSASRGLSMFRMTQVACRRPGTAFTGRRHASANGGKIGRCAKAPFVGASPQGCSAERIGVRLPNYCTGGWGKIAQYGGSTILTAGRLVASGSRIGTIEVGACAGRARRGACPLSGPVAENEALTRRTPRSKPWIPRRASTC